MDWPLSRAFKAGVIALGGTLALASCNMQAPNSGKGGASQIVIGTSNIAETLDPLQASDAHNDFNLAPMYDRLVNYDANGKLVPQLATSWKFDADATHLTLRLRDGAAFHSGNPFTARDVAYTLDRAKKIGSGVAAFLTNYVSAEAVDPDHVRITLKEHDLTFVGALSRFYIVDSQLVGKHEGADNGQGWLATHEAGSGPFAMAHYTANQEIRLKRSADYWAFDKGRPEAVVLRMQEDRSGSRDELLAGDIDLTVGLSGADVEQVRKNGHFKFMRLPVPRETYGWMNMKGGITADPKVREAVQLAYDYKGHLTSALGGQGQIADSLLPEGIACRADAGKPKQDLGRAKALIREAGVEGKTVTIAYQPTVDEFNVAGTILQDSLKKIGLKAELQAVTFPQYSARVSKQSTMPDIALAWDFASYPEAGPQLDREYNSAFAGSTNYTWYADRQVDRWLKEGNTAPTASKACAAFTKAQNKILADHALLYIAYPAITVLSDGRVRNIPFSPTQQDFNVGFLRMAR
ncbi:ABC transporter substrate-binding protein [Streptomyces antnestii]|uniref:ABC transporter substrate-binding protein n=1 Tax=Streptomyces antnestii TaxID=2494256 RepID=A0A437Q2V1_9ACTN|nr:ABC transporter substrate-binding protein [Streptomyces sp. San01]RVU28829.1 ABC transporter substrate-binding protein [Streptomyces sp. San01]